MNRSELRKMIKGLNNNERKILKFMLEHCDDSGTIGLSDDICTTTYCIPEFKKMQNYFKTN